MPTYEYACKDCGQHVEVVHSMTDESLSTCGACGGVLRKVFHPTGIMFKGSGFYATDSRKKSTPAAAKDLKDMSTADIKAEGAKAAEKSAGTAAKTGDGAGSSGSSKKKEKSA